MVIYLKLIGLFVFIIVSLGIVVPSLISEPNTFAMVTGFILLFATPAIIYYFGKDIMSDIKKSKGETS